MRIKYRKFGRTGQSTYSSNATHVIKIGFDARSPKDERPKPGKLNGFLICRDSLDASNNLVVDFDAMQALGIQYSPDMIGKAKAQQMKAPAGILPTELHFVLTHDAQRVPGGWEFPGTFSEAYECWQKSGLFCEGDGHAAKRKQNDGTRKEIECVPMGKEGAEAEKFCPYSVDKSCKGHSRLILCLFVEDAQGKPQPLSKALGWQARYRFDTSSGYNPIRIVNELDQAAERLQGHLAGITGTLTYQLQRKRYAEGVAIVGQIMFSLSEADIRRREEEVWNRNLEYKKVSIGLLTGPAPTATPDSPDAAPAPEPCPFENAPEFVADAEEVDDLPWDEQPAEPQAETAPEPEPQPAPEPAPIPPEPEPGPATDGQMSEIRRLAQLTSTPLGKIADWAKVGHINDITNELAAEAMVVLNKKLAKMGKEAAHANR